MHFTSPEKKTRLICDLDNEKNIEDIQQEINHLDLLSTPVGAICSVVPLARKVLWKSTPLPTKCAVEDFKVNLASPFEGKLNENWKINKLRLLLDVEKMIIFEKIKSFISLQLVDFASVTLHFKAVRILHDPGGQPLHKMDG